MSGALPNQNPIALQGLRELWVHTGTACNLSCPFCHEGSQPGDTRLQALSAQQIAPILLAAAAAGVERYIFTGGEPLTARDIVPMLSAALALRPTLVLTNGTAPLIRRSHQLAALAQQQHALSFRVSIDFYDEARHDAARGPQNFRKALQGLRLLREAGFEVSVACQRDAMPQAEVALRFARLFQRHGLPATLPLVQLPELGRPRSVAIAAAPLPEHAFNAAGKVMSPCCSRGRMLLRRDGLLRLQACPLTDDDPRFDLGQDLGAALQAGVMPVHARCRICLEQGIDYAGQTGP